MSDRGVFIRYKGDDIVHLEKDGELLLLTKNSFLEDDIEVEVKRAETLVSKTVTQNGAYDPADDDADGYSGVTVNVPNTYAAGDEGKVVYNGALVAQGSQTVTQNGTYDTTLKNEVIVDVEGGGGGGGEPIDYSYLPNSDADNVLASSDYTMLDGLKVGAFDVFVYPSLYNLTSTPFELTVDANGLYLQYGVKVGKWLSDANTDVTVYFVGKRTTNARYFVFMDIPYALSNGNSPSFYNNIGTYAVETTIFASNASTVYSSDTEHIYAISLDASTKTAKWYIDGNLLRTYNYGNSGNIALIGGGAPTTLDYDSDIYFKYGGVVEECESDATIIANMQAIATKLGITI